MSCILPSRQTGGGGPLNDLALEKGVEEQRRRRRDKDAGKGQPALDIVLPISSLLPIRTGAIINSLRLTAPNFPDVVSHVSVGRVAAISLVWPRQAAPIIRGWPAAR